MVLVECQRGVGDVLRPVLQVWSREGTLLAEHDHIHPDPIYAACHLRSDTAFVASLGGQLQAAAQEVV